MEEKVTWLSRVGMMGLLLLIFGFLCVGILVAPNLQYAPPSGKLHFTEMATHAHAASTNPQGLPDFVNLAKKLRPAVVNISTSQVGGGRRTTTVTPEPFWRGGPL